MTTLAALIEAQVRRPTISLYLNGRRCTRVLRARVSQAYGSSGISGGTIVLRDPPREPTEGDAIRWTWGYNGYEVPGFTGYVTRITDNSYPSTWELEVQDVLWLAQREQRPIVTSPLNSIGATAAIEYILETYAGITRTDLPTIEIGGSAWTLGVLTPVSWDKTTALAACQEIAQTAGYWLYADAGGTVRATLIERRPSDSPFRTFRRGVDLLMNGAPQRVRDGNQVKNRITVRGASTGVEGAQLYDTFQATHALYPGVVADLEYSSFLLEYIADVTACAERLAGVWNRRPNIVRARIKADPRLRAGVTVAIQDSGIGYSSAVPFFLYSLDTEIDLAAGKFDQQVVLDGGTGSAGYTTIPNPVAVIAVRVLERETVDGTALTVIAVDGSGSYSLSGGEIVAWAWSIADTPYSGTANSATGATATFIIPDSEAPFSITLTVTDTTSKTGTTTVDVPLTGDAGATVVQEAVHAAAGSSWWYTPDGGATVNKDVRTCTIVAEGAGVWDTAPTTDGETYGALATSSTQVRQTLDGLATASVLLNTAGGSITALSVNARDAARVWRAVGTTVQRSTNGGTTWTTMGTAPASVRQILEDPALDGRLFALAGANLITSADSGATWSTLYAGPSGATARWFVRSESGTITWVCYTGTFSGSPLQRVETAAGAASWSATTPTEIRAIALTEESIPRLVAIDAGSPPKVWIGDAATGAMVAGPSLPSGATVQHATASRRAPVVYIADFDSEAVGTGALRKLIMDQSTGVLLPWYPGATGEQYHMVQLASVAREAVYTLLVCTKGLTPGGVYVKTPTGAWTLTNSGLPSGWDWEAVAASPFSSSEWLLIGRPIGSTADTITTSSAPYEVEIDGTGKSPFWRTTDGGATYTEYRVTSGARGYANGSFVNDDRRATYTSQGEIAVKVELAETVGGNIYLNIWRGGTQVVHEDVGTRPNAFNGSGAGGDLLATYSDSTGATFYRGYVPGGGTGLTGFTTSAFRQSLLRDAGGSHAAFSLVSNTVLRYDDYRASGSGTTIASGLTGLANVRALADALYAKTSAGIVQIDDPTGTPVVTTVRSGTYDSNMGRSDQGAQQYLVVRTGTTLEVWDGATWATVAAPSGLVDADMYALGIIDVGAV